MNIVNTLQELTKEDARKAVFEQLSRKAIDVLSEMNKPINEGVRKVGEFSLGRHKAVIYKDSDYGEHKVKFHTDGKHLTDADYFTDDKEDAQGTAEHQVKQLHAKDKE